MAAWMRVFMLKWFRCVAMAENSRVRVAAATDLSNSYFQLLCLYLQQRLRLAPARPYPRIA